MKKLAIIMRDGFLWGVGFATALLLVTTVQQHGSTKGSKMRPTMLAVLQARQD